MVIWLALQLVIFKNLSNILTPPDNKRAKTTKTGNGMKIQVNLIYVYMLTSSPVVGCCWIFKKLCDCHYCKVDVPTQSRLLC